MRIGFNPNKDQKIAPTDFFHQVIVPVHIPNQEGYFKDSFQIFQYCLESLFKTCHDKTYFTVVNNGSCTVVVNYLHQLQQEGKLHEVVHTTAIGKLNAILKGLTGHPFPLVTITDADVLFLNGWQQASYEVFEAFPRAGAVCPVPSSKVLKQLTANVLLDNLFSKRLKFTAVKNKEALKMFALSIGDSKFYKEVHLDKNLTLSSEKGMKAVIGAGHFVATYRSEVYKRPKSIYSKYKMGSVMREFLDQPVIEKGFWRFSTDENYAYHLGNVKESWMEEEFSKIRNEKIKIEQPILKKVFTNKLAIWIKTVLFARIIFRKPIWKLYLRWKGLSKQEANEY